MLYGFYGPIALTLLSPIEYYFGTVASIAVIAASHGYMVPDSCVLLFIDIYMAYVYVCMAPLVVNASIAPPMAPLTPICFVCSSSLAYIWHIYMLCSACSVCSYSSANSVLAYIYMCVWLSWPCSSLFMNLLCIPLASCHPLVSRILPY